jgi:diketogulonate reductase-like aldo/keto reductase
MTKRPLSRRDFNGLCGVTAAAGVLGGTPGAWAMDAPTGTASTRAKRTVKFPDGIVVPALGQGSAQLAQGRHPEAVEEEALRSGLSLGMTLIDTAELYGDGRSEKLISRVIAGQRDRVFLVSKVWQSHATRSGIPPACDASLTRLGTDHLDLYLLHWPTGVTDLAGVVAAFRRGRSVPGESPTLT